MKTLIVAVLVSSGVVATAVQANALPADAKVAAPAPAAAVVKPAAAPAAAPTVTVNVPADPGLQPTRMQYCQHEVKAVSKGRHKAELSACLKRRSDGERAIARDCKKEVGNVEAPLNTAQRTQWQRACEARLLGVHSKSLPKGPPPKPRKPKAKPTAGGGDAPSAAPAAEAAPAPAAPAAPTE